MRQWGELWGVLRGVWLVVCLFVLWVVEVGLKTNGTNSHFEILQYGSEYGIPFDYVSIALYFNTNDTVLSVTFDQTFQVKLNTPV